MVKTLDRTFYFFAKEEHERRFWLESFAKVIESHKSGQANFDLRSRPELKQLQESDSKASQNQTKLNIDSQSVYISKHLEVT